MDGIIAMMAGLLGLIVGSFLNVLVHRLPRGEDFIHGRSHCPHCGHDLGPADLVPVISYLWLRRRCRYCMAPISARYAIVEITTAVLYAGAWLIVGTLSPPGFVMAAGILSLSIVMVCIRIDRNRIPRVLFWAEGALCAGLLLILLFGPGNR